MNANDTQELYNYIHADLVKAMRHGYAILYDMGTTAQIRVAITMQLEADLYEARRNIRRMGKGRGARPV